MKLSCPKNPPFGCVGEAAVGVPAEAAVVGLVGDAGHHEGSPSGRCRWRAGPSPRSTVSSRALGRAVAVVVRHRRLVRSRRAGDVLVLQVVLDLLPLGRGQRAVVDQRRADLELALAEAGDLGADDQLLQVGGEGVGAAVDQRAVEVVAERAALQHHRLHHPALGRAVDVRNRSRCRRPSPAASGPGRCTSSPGRRPGSSRRRRRRGPRPRPRRRCNSPRRTSSGRRCRPEARSACRSRSPAAAGRRCRRRRWRRARSASRRRSGVGSP